MADDLKTPEATAPTYSSVSASDSEQSRRCAAQEEIAVVESRRWYPTGISVVFPAFNEESNVELTIEAAFAAFAAHFAEVEIIIVNDGSSDGTGDLLDDLARKHPNLRPLHHQRNHGYGAALRTGISNATKDLIFFSDADLQFDLTEIHHLVEYIHNHDMVIGFRSRRADPWHRRLNAWGWNMIVRLVFGIKVKDIDCAFKLFRRQVFERIALQSVGAMINTELLARARQRKMTWKEIPVAHYPRVAGNQTGASPRVVLKALTELVIMRKKLKQSDSLKEALLAPSVAAADR